MLQFLDGSQDLSAALPGTYDLILVTLSYLVATIAAYAGLLLCERIGYAESAKGRWAWLGAGAFSMGTGVWAMHFIGMLAFVLPIAIHYDPWITLASVFPAIIACAVALTIISRGRRIEGRVKPLHTVIAGVLIGAGIGAMHYTGMAAMRMDAMMYYDPALFVMSIAVAAALGVAALFAEELLHGVWGWDAGRWLNAISAAIIGLAISGMHYTAMGATYFFPFDFPGVEHVGKLDRFWLSVAVFVVTAVIVAFAVVAARVDERLQSAAQLLRVSRERMVEAVESISDGFIMFDANGGLVMCNRVFRDMYPDLAALLKPNTPYAQVLRAWSGLKGEGAPDAATENYVDECLRRFESGAATVDTPEEDQLDDGRWVYIRQRTMESGGVVGVWADVTPIKQLQKLYEEQAHRDVLTGLPNRQLFEDRLEHAARHAKRLKATFALLYVDLDRFKPINDTLGHAAGDEVLREVARRLQASVRESDTVARLGGDEFAVILEPQGDREHAEAVAERILQNVAAPIDIGGQECSVGASVGIALSAAEDFDKLALIRNADAAMYEAKKASGNAYRVRGG